MDSRKKETNLIGYIHHVKQKKETN